MTNPTKPEGDQPTGQRTIRDIIQGLQQRASDGDGLNSDVAREQSFDRKLKPQERRERWGRYEFNLAEFPLFRFQANAEGDLLYEDEIKAKDGSPLKRRWRVSSADTHGIGGESLQRTLFDLLQLFHEQGAAEKRIYYKSVTNLLRRRGYKRENVSKKNRDQIRRDLEQLCSYRVEAVNAWWDHEMQAYGHMKGLGLFGPIVDYSEGPNGQQPLFQSYIEIQPRFMDLIAGSNTFLLPFGSTYYHSLGPNPARLATYLGKMLRSQHVHRKPLALLAKQLPLEYKEAKYVKRSLKSSLAELHKKAGFKTAWTKNAGKEVMLVTAPDPDALTGDFPLLKRVEFYKGADRQSMIAFFRADRPKKAKAAPRDEHTMSFLVQKMIDVTGDHTSAARWAQFTRKLSQADIELALEDMQTKKEKVKNRGALLNAILMAKATEKGLKL